MIWPYTALCIKIVRFDAHAVVFVADHHDDGNVGDDDGDDVERQNEQKKKI